LGHKIRTLPEHRYTFRRCARCNKDLSKKRLTILFK